MTVVWADLSHHVTTVDLDAYFSRYDRLGHKVSEGTGYEDPMFATRYAYCRQRGLPFSGYHFDRAKYAGGTQFDWFADCIRRAGGPRPWPLDTWCLDSEDTDTPGRAAASSKEFTARAVTKGVANGLVYSGLWFAQPYGLRLDALPAGWQRGWLSDYVATHSDATMPLPPGWPRAKVVARQYTSSATLVGVSGPCDANRTLIDWMAGGAVTSPSGWTAEDRAVVRGLLDERLRGFVAALASGDLNSVTGGPSTGAAGQIPQLRAAVDALTAKAGADLAGLAESVTALAAQVAAVEAKLETLSVAGIDTAALVKAINDDAARRLEE